MHAHAPLAMFRLLDLDHPTLQLPAGIVGAVHTSPFNWRVSDVNGDAVQILPHAVPFLQGQQLHAFMLATDSTRVLRGIPGKDKQGHLLMADTLRYSRVQHAVLIFLAHVEVCFMPHLTGTATQCCPTTYNSQHGVVGKKVSCIRSKLQRVTYSPLKRSCMSVSTITRIWRPAIVSRFEILIWIF
jgi:hypothetical protein